MVDCIPRSLRRVVRRQYLVRFRGQLRANVLFDVGEIYFKLLDGPDFARIVLVLVFKFVAVDGRRGGRPSTGAARADHGAIVVAPVVR